MHEDTKSQRVIDQLCKYFPIFVQIEHNGKRCAMDANIGTIFEPRSIKVDEDAIHEDNYYDEDFDDSCTQIIVNYGNGNTQSVRAYPLAKLAMVHWTEYMRISGEDFRSFEKEFDHFILQTGIE